MLIKKKIVNLVSYANLINSMEAKENHALVNHNGRNHVIITDILCHTCDFYVIISTFMS